MAGLNYGNKYKYSHNVRDVKEEKEGVWFSEKSKKWVVNIENQTPSRFARPVIRVAQFETINEALDCFNIEIEKKINKE